MPLWCTKRSSPPSSGDAITRHTAKRGDKLYRFYSCHRRVDYSRDSCQQRMAWPERAEAAMWEFVSRGMKDPGRILLGMDALIKRKRAELRGVPEWEVAS